MYLRQAKPARCSRWKPSADMRDLHSLKLTEHQKNGGWETILFFWETPFSGTFVVKFRESTFFWVPKKPLSSGHIRFWPIWWIFEFAFRWVVYVKNAYSFMGKLFPPSPKTKFSFGDAKECWTYFVIQSKWPFWGMVNFRDPFGKWLKTWPPTKKGMKFGHIHSPGDCCRLNLPEAVIGTIQNVPRRSRREPTHPEAAHTTPMEQNNVTLEQLQLQWVMMFTFCKQ